MTSVQPLDPRWHHSGPREGGARSGRSGEQRLGRERRPARLDTPRQVVSKWRKRFYEQRLAGLDDHPRGGRPPAFPPAVVVAIKALASELPATNGAPLARWHTPDLARAAVDYGIVAATSGATIWRWLSADAVNP